MATPYVGGQDRIVSDIEFFRSCHRLESSAPTRELSIVLLGLRPQILEHAAHDTASRVTKLCYGIAVLSSTCRRLETREYLKLCSFTSNRLKANVEGPLPGMVAMRLIRVAYISWRRPRSCSYGVCDQNAGHDLWCISNIGVFIALMSYHSLMCRTIPISMRLCGVDNLSHLLFLFIGQTQVP